MQAPLESKSYPILHMEHLLDMEQVSQLGTRQVTGKTKIVIRMNDCHGDEPKWYQISKLDQIYSKK